MSAVDSCLCTLDSAGVLSSLAAQSSLVQLDRKLNTTTARSGKQQPAANFAGGGALSPVVRFVFVLELFCPLVATKRNVALFLLVIDIDSRILGKLPVVSEATSSFHQLPPSGTVSPQDNLDVSYVFFDTLNRNAPPPHTHTHTPLPRFRCVTAALEGSYITRL